MMLSGTDVALQQLDWLHLLTWDDGLRAISRCLTSHLERRFMDVDGEITSFFQTIARMHYHPHRDFRIPPSLPHPAMEGDG